MDAVKLTDRQTIPLCGSTKRRIGGGIIGRNLPRDVNGAKRIGPYQRHITGNSIARSNKEEEEEEEEEEEGRGICLDSAHISNVRESREDKRKKKGT